MLSGTIDLYMLVLRLIGNMNNIGRNGDESAGRMAIAGMFDIPAVFRCPVRDPFVRQWCNENKDILCFVNKVTTCFR